MIGGGNVATILLMLIAGYADLLPPQRFPLLACMGLAFPGFLIVNMAFLVFWLIFKPRLSLLPIIGVLLVLPPLQVYCPIHVKTTPPSGTIKVLSYNVQAYSGHPRYDDAFKRAVLFEPGYVKYIFYSFVFCAFDKCAGIYNDNIGFDILCDKLHSVIYELCKHYLGIQKVFRASE